MTDWWQEELERHWGDGMCTDDTRRAAKTALAEVELLRAEVIQYKAALEASRAETVRTVDALVEEKRRLRALLQKLHWKSIDKDNMEYSCRVPYNVMDEIRRALDDGLPTADDVRGIMRESKP